MGEMSSLDTKHSLVLGTSGIRDGVQPEVSGIKYSEFIRHMIIGQRFFFHAREETDGYALLETMR